MKIKTRRSIYSHIGEYGRKSTKNQEMLNLKHKHSRRRKNKLARNQRVLNSNHK